MQGYPGTKPGCYGYARVGTRVGVPGTKPGGYGYTRIGTRLGVPGGKPGGYRHSRCPLRYLVYCKLVFSGGIPGILWYPDTKPGSYGYARVGTRVGIPGTKPGGYRHSCGGTRAGIPGYQTWLLWSYSGRYPGRGSRVPNLAAMVILG